MLGNLLLTLAVAILGFLHMLSLARLMALAEDVRMLQLEMERLNMQEHRRFVRAMTGVQDIEHIQ